MGAPIRLNGREVEQLRVSAWLRLRFHRADAGRLAMRCVPRRDMRARAPSRSSPLTSGSVPGAGPWDSVPELSSSRQVGSFFVRRLQPPILTQLIAQLSDAVLRRISSGPALRRADGRVRPSSSLFGSNGTAVGSVQRAASVACMAYARAQWHVRVIIPTRAGGVVSTAASDTGMSR